MKVFPLSVIAGALFALTLGAANSQEVFNFDGIVSHGLNVGQPVDGTSLPSNTNTATVSLTNPSKLFMYNDNLDPTTGNAIFGQNLRRFLVGVSGAGAGDLLTLTFSGPVTRLTFDFATLEAGSLSLTGAGTTETFSASSPGAGVTNATPDTQTGGFDGTFTFTSANPFNSVTLSSNDAGLQDFGINYLVTTPANVPEPGALAMFATASLTGVSLLRRKRRA